MMRMHGPAQGHDTLSRTKNPTGRLGALCPRLREENFGPPGILRLQANVWSNTRKRERDKMVHVIWTEACLKRRKRWGWPE